MTDEGLTVMDVSVWFTVTFTLLVTVRPGTSAIVTVKVYAPALLNVAVVFFAAFVPLALKVGAVAPLGSVVAAQVYFRFASPPSSAPKTERLVVVPVTVLGVALAAVPTVGAWLVTLNVAVPLTVPLLAVTVPLPVVGAVNRPLVLIVPAVVAQVNVGCVAKAVLN